MTVDLSPGDLELCMQVREVCACNGLRRVTRGVTALYDAALAPSGLKVTQLPILVALGSAGDLPITTLAGALALDRTTLTRNLHVLEQRGLVCVASSDDDARVRMASLTPGGAEALSGALARWEDVQRTVRERFGEQRLRTLYDELAALSAAVAA
jgi:DNA-binding MarR family transcriptional regulator